MSLSKLEKTIITTAFGVVVLSGLLIFTDGWDWLTKPRRGGTPIGKFSSLNNDVRHKWNREISWRPSTPGDSVEENDFVFAGAESSALVEFYDGYQLEIEPQSLVKIEREAEQTSLAFDFGLFKVSGASKRPLVIKTKMGKAKITVSQDAKVLIERKENSNIATIRVIDGTANVESDGKPQTPVAPGEEINIEVPFASVSKSVAQTDDLPSLPAETFKPSAEDQTISQTLPETKQLPEETSLDVPVEQTAIDQTRPALDPIEDSGTNYQASQLPTDVAIPNLDLSFPTASQLATEQSAPPTGSNEQNNELSPLDKALLATAPKIQAQLIRPSREQKRKGAQLGINIEIENFQAESAPFEVEIASDPNFKKSKTIQVNEPITKWPQTTAGTYYLRLKPSREPSAIEKQQIVQSKVVIPKAVDLKPAPSNRPRSNEVLILPSAQQGLDFRWNPMDSASVYDFELSRDKDFKELVASQTIEGKTDLYLQGLFSSGEYYWRIRSATKFEESEWSSPKRFQVIVPK